MTSQSLVPNYALKALIEEASGKSPAAPPALVSPTHVIPPPALSVTSDGTRLTITITGPDIPIDATLPTLFIDVLDISGSMGSSSMDTSHQAGSDAAAFSRADLVRHSVATQIELLRPQDELAVILFDNNATVALPPLSMRTGRGPVKSVLDQIDPRGGTNIWTGLHSALTLAASADAVGKNVVIILQTDGESDPSYNPPRGIVPTLQAWLDAHPTVRPTIHTVGYGFGRALDMPLLRQIAAAGRGTVNYIPDGSMVGTVFIHMLANLMSLTHRDLTLSVPEFGWTESVGFLQAGQTRQFMTPSCTELPVTIALRDNTGPLLHMTAYTTTTSDDSRWPTLREKAIDTIRTALLAAEAGNTGAAAHHIAELTTYVRGRMATDTNLLTPALLTDLADSNPAKGQISKAFANAAAFERWGRHFVPAYLSGLESDWAINFKDALSQVPRSSVVATHIQRGDDIFNSLPPPRASCSRYASGGYAAASPLATMSSIHNSSGVCFLGASLVKMADGTEKRCDQIQPGDVDIAGYRIKCVLKTLVTKADIVRVGAAHNANGGLTNGRYAEGGFTLWHPVFVGGAWQHPADVGIVETVQTDALYNFVLEQNGSPPNRPGVLIVDGIMTCTLGHGLTGTVIGHPYFGDRIIADLAGCRGWPEGYVTWGRSYPVRDPATGLITHMDFIEI
jgi:Mg-chelatase subunit ChlD